MSHPLTKALQDLIDTYGLDLVYTTLRETWDDQFCGNCGCPLTKTEKHIAYGLGMCSLEVS